VLNNRVIKNIVEKYDSTGAYKSFYALKDMRDGFSIYSIHNGYLLYFIEIGETEHGNEMHVNYYVKYNTLEKEKIISDEEFMNLVSSIAYYFGINSVVIYAEYKSCATKVIKLNRQRGFGSFDNSIVKQNNDVDEVSLNGNYCIDFYHYLKDGVKRFASKKIATMELRPKFSYFDLEYLKKENPEKILSKDDRDEVYQIYHKVYKQKETSIADFLLWIIDNKCYLIEYFIPKINKIYGDNNPFRNDMYLLEPITYLYNRRLISTYASVIQDDIYKSRDVYTPQKNEYRLLNTRIRQKQNNIMKQF